jgi:hypothetical protein
VDYGLFGKLSIRWFLKATDKMKIEDLKIKKKENRKRAAAMILWEDCDRPAQELYFRPSKNLLRMCGVIPMH